MTKCIQLAMITATIATLGFLPQANAKSKTDKQVDAPAPAAVTVPAVDPDLDPTAEPWFLGVPADSDTKATSKKAKKKAKRAKKRKKVSAAQKRAQRYGIGISKAPTPQRSRERTLPRGDELLRITPRGLPRSTVSRVVRSYSGHIERCQVALGDKAAGAIVLKFNVSPDGKLRKASVQHSSKSKTLSRCIRRAMKTWRFPAAEGPTDVEYPVTMNVARK